LATLPNGAVQPDSRHCFLISALKNFMASFYGEILPVVSRAILDSDSEDDDDNEV